MREADALQSRIEQVTVFASGARVRRVASVPGPLPDRVRIVDLPVAVIDDTVRVEVRGGAVATAVRAGWMTPAGESEPEESTELRAARVRFETAKAEVQRLELALERLAKARLVVDDPTEQPPAAWDSVLRARRSLVTMRAERQLALRDQLIAARREVDAAKRALDVAIEHDRAAGTARGAKAHEQRKHVEIDLVAQPGGGDTTLHLEYQIAAARWAPSYVARLDGEATRFELRAVVAQNSGEDWTDVALRLSTAEPDQFAPLPELHPQKIGRRQAEPARRGFRAPPAGAEALYADYQRGFPPQPSTKTGAIGADFEDSTYEGRVPAPPPPKPAPMPDGFVPPSGEVWDEESSRAKDAYQTPPGPMPALSSMPAPAPVARAKRSVAGGIVGAVAAPFARMAEGAAGAPGGAPPGARREQAPPPAPTPRLDYGNLRMASADTPQRGKLVPAPPPTDRAGSQRAADALAALTRLPLPPGHLATWGHTYDYAFASDGTVEVKSDGAWHSLALTSRPGSAKIRHVAVPREQSDVFRVATITNPFAGPLLPGPIDVYDRGQFLVTSEVDFTPSGGSVDVGLGVDPTVKIARNAEFHEEAAGMLRGALKLFHSITIDVENLSARTLDLEVRERIPVTQEGDDDVEVTIGRVEPAWRRWAPEPDAPLHARLRGGHAWRVDVAPRSKQQLRASYEIKIAGKNELVGGNRREP